MLSDTIRDHIASTVTASQLDALPREVWGAHLAGRLSDDEAQALSEAIEARRAAFRERRAFTAPGTLGAPGEAPGRPGGHLTKRRCPFTTGKARPRSQDRERSRRRRYDVARCQVLPPAIEAQLTPCESAALAIIGREVATKGTCQLTKGQIAAEAGVSPESVRYALRAGVELGLIEVRERRQRQAPNLPNLITITSSEWRTWLHHRPMRARWPGWKGRGSKTHPTKDQIQIHSRKHAQDGSRRPARRDEGPPDRGSDPV